MARTAGNARMLLLLVIGAVIGLVAVFLIVGPGSHSAQEDPASSEDRGQIAWGDSETLLAVEDPADSAEEPELVVVEPEAVRDAEDGRASPPSVTIKMHFLDSQHAPLSGVTVKAWVFKSPILAESDSTGSVTLILPFAGDTTEQTGLNFRAWRTCFKHHRERRKVAAGETIDFGEIVLEPAGEVAGRVLDRTGRPLPLMSVYYTDSDISSLDMEKARREGIRFQMDSDFGAVSVSDGSFRAVGLKPGLKRFWAGSIDYLYTCSDPVEVALGREVLGVDLVLDERPREQLIECLVLDPEGNPAKGVRVKLFYKNGATSKGIDDRGRFVHLVREEGPYSLEAMDTEGRWERVRLEEVKPGAPDQTLQFGGPARKLRLRVSSGGPESPSEFTAIAWDRSLRSAIESRRDMRRTAPGGRGTQYFEHVFRPADRAEDGTVSLAFPKGEFFVTVRAEGYGTVERGPFHSDRPPDPIKIILDPVAGLSGRVVTEDGAMEGARISLHREAEPRRTVEVIDFACRSERDEADHATTGPDGSFVLCPSEPGRYFLRAVKKGFAPAEAGPLDLDPRERREGVELAFTAGGTIAGRVVVTSGRDPAGIVVGASRGDGFPIVACAGRDGAYRFEHLTPGPWRVEKRTANELDESRWSQIRFSAEGTREKWSCTVVEGETTRHDLDLSHETVCRLDGRIVTKALLSGSWYVDLALFDQRPPVRGDSRYHGEELESSVPCNGRFSLKSLAAGMHVLKLRGLFETGRKLKIEELIDLTGGETSWEWNVPLATIEVRPPSSGLEEKQRLTCFWKGEGDRIAYMGFDMDPDSPVKLYPVPAGQFRIVKWGRDPAMAPSILAEGKADSGETTVVTLRRDND
jgi:hypothetical protein